MKYARNLGVEAAMLVLPLLATTARADTVTYSLNTSNGCCGTGPFGTVKVDDTGGNLTFDVTMLAGFHLHLVGGQDVFGFNLSGSPTITITGFASTFSAVSPQTAGEHQFDGLQQYMYSLTGNPPPNQADSLHFVVDAASDLTIASLITGKAPGGGPNAPQYGSGLYLFAVDFCSDCANSVTGFAAGGPRLPDGGGGGGGEVPLPAAVWLMGSVLGGGAGFGAWRRRRRAKAA